MTIAIKITNDDSRRTAIVSVNGINPESSIPIKGFPVTVLQGGESTTTYVHSTQSLLIEELENN